jgi:hypothetical protein
MFCTVTPPKIDKSEEGMLQDVTSITSQSDAHAALKGQEPCISMWSSSASRDPLVQNRANAGRSQRNDAVCTACPVNSPTFRLRGACNPAVASWTSVALFQST